MKAMIHENEINLETLYNKGFSLVEVLVCIAIIAIVSIPIFSSFRLSADNTRRAHENQKVTAYAQDILEKAKSMEVSAFDHMIKNILDTDGNKSGTSTKTLDAAQKGLFDASYPEELFTTIDFNLPDIEIGGSAYEVGVLFDPLYYSKVKDPALAGDDTPSDNANVYAVNNVDSLNGMLFPVISDEISSYEGPVTSASGVLYNLLEQAKKSEKPLLGSSEDEQLENIYHNLSKTVTVEISNSGSESLVKPDAGSPDTYLKGSIRVRCSLTYESVYGGVSLRQVYNVFSAEYELLGKIVDDSVTPAQIDWERGGKVYIFAKAFQDQFFRDRGLDYPASNKMEIINDYSGTGKLDLYLVRGHYFDDISGTNARGLNFDEISITTAGGNHIYSALPATVTDVFTGEYESGSTSFHTNVKKTAGVAFDKILSADDRNQSIGEENPSLRCYLITVSIKEKDTSKEVARVTTTKKIT